MTGVAQGVAEAGHHEIMVASCPGASWKGWGHIEAQASLLLVGWQGSVTQINMSTIVASSPDAPQTLRPGR